MKIAFASPILDDKDRPIPIQGGLDALVKHLNDRKDQDEITIGQLKKLLTGDGTDVLTLQAAAESSLLTQFTDEQSLSRAEKRRRYNLFLKIHAGGDELDVEEAKMLKDAIGRHQPTLVMGRCFDIIEATPKTEPFDAGTDAGNDEPHQEA